MVDQKTIDQWKKEAREWAEKLKKSFNNFDLPPGFEAGDELEYTFKV